MSDKPRTEGFHDTGCKNDGNTAIDLFVDTVENISDRLLGS